MSRNNRQHLQNSLRFCLEEKAELPLTNSLRLCPEEKTGPPAEMMITLRSWLSMSWVKSAFSDSSIARDKAFLGLYGWRIYQRKSSNFNYQSIATNYEVIFQSF